MKIREYCKKIKSTPFRLILKKSIRKFKRSGYRLIWKIKDNCIDSREKHSKLKMNVLPFFLKDLDFSGITSDLAEKFWIKYHTHEFNLLGSGWLNCGYLNNSPGFEGNKYVSTQLKTDFAGDFLIDIVPAPCLKKSKEYWKKIEQPYQGINWQRDFKSGYEWKTTDWFYPLRLAAQPGGDVKVPWELGRLQHLPRLAICYYFLTEERSEIQREYQNQLLDFFSQNPIRWGVQSMCCMDMGIRVANIVLSYSMFRIQGMKFDDAFETIVADEIFNICRHIYHNVEWSDEFTNNHYLANLVGLLFGGAGICGNNNSDKWMRYAGSQLEKEFEKQFYPEGTNKEGSTAYHRLSSELIIYSLILGKRLNVVKNIDYCRLAGSLDFLRTVTRPDHRITSIGDNDSGLLFRLSFTGHDLEEELNDARPTISALAACFKEQRAVDFPLEYSLVRGLYKEKKEPFFCSKQELDVLENIEYSGLPFSNHWKFQFNQKNLLEGMEIKAFKQFGLYIWKSCGLYLCVTIADNGQGGNGGHAHNDKLSFELFAEGKGICEDPGTYVYTASEELRNSYRSTSAHNTVWTGQEQNDFNGLFSMRNETTSKVGKFTAKEFLAEVRYKDVIHVRKINITDGGIEISDYCNKEIIKIEDSLTICDGYGQKREEET